MFAGEPRRLARQITYFHFIKISPDDTLVISQTTEWIKAVVIGCNFCPFAAKPFHKKTIRYTVLSSGDLQLCLNTLLSEFTHLDEHENTETTFIIFKNDYTDFNSYLNLAEEAERFLAKNNYEGIYQVASFHPEYCFAGSAENDAANYTNRSVYPMLHILREDSITKALEHFANPESIPDTNIDFARKKGLEYMQLLKASCM